MRVLFIDERSDVLSGLQDALRSMDRPWELEFAGSGSAALACMEERPADIVISHWLRPGMNGARLFRELAQLYPATARYIVGAQAQSDGIFQCIASSETYFSKDTDARESSQAAIEAAALRDLLLRLHQSVRASISCEANTQGGKSAADIGDLIRSLKQKVHASA